MADYTPLIARAVEGLERNTGENRRVLYERARGALVAQLRSIDPPLEETDITRERLALEDAIRSVETEATRRSREAPNGGQNGQSGGDDARQPAASSPRSLADQALSGFRANMAEAEGLGGAAAQANKSARGFYPEEEHSAHHDDTEHAHGGEDALPETMDQPARDGLAEISSPPWDEPRSAPHDTEDETYRRPRRSYRGLIAFFVIVLLLGGLGAAAYWQRTQVLALANKAIATFTALRASPPAAPPRETTPAQPKITDRVGSQSEQPAGRSANAPAADVAQKVVLYEEEQNNPQGKRYVGSAIWRTETVSPGPGLAPELAIRADVEIPERHLRMTWSLRRNTDKALPASHTIEIMFTLPADFAEGGIQNVPGVLMKQNEQARGVPLAGLAVKVTNGFFLIGLNSTEVDLARNVALLKERSWFDIPIVYNSNKRAILAMEKGTPGERAFEDAFRTWGQ
jgi:hypothetical protein